MATHRRTLINSKFKGKVAFKPRKRKPPSQRRGAARRSSGPELKRR